MQSSVTDAVDYSMGWYVCVCVACINTALFYHPPCAILSDCISPS